jgi:hypothetical protein
MKRLTTLCLLLLALLGIQLATPGDARASWGCGAGPPQCVYGGPRSQCDSRCGVNLGQCVKPGCCQCLAV